MAAYSASKAAVIGLTKVIGKEYAEIGGETALIRGGVGDLGLPHHLSPPADITCNAVSPAVVRTAMVDALPAEQIKYMTDKVSAGCSDSAAPSYLCVFLRRRALPIVRSR